MISSGNKLFFTCIQCLGILLTLIVHACQNNSELQRIITNELPPDLIDFSGTPDSASDRSSFAYSDKGAWFAYGIPTDPDHYGGFTGPFLLTQDNGVWSSPILSQLELLNSDNNQIIKWNDFKKESHSFLSHMEQKYESKTLRIEQKLFFVSAHSALILTDITNLSDKNLSLHPKWKGTLIQKGLSLSTQENYIQITSNASTAIGTVRDLTVESPKISIKDSSYQMVLQKFELNPGGSKQLLISHSFIFPQYNSLEEENLLSNVKKDPFASLQNEISKKEDQLKLLIAKVDTVWSGKKYENLIAKTVLTLQNNWRIPAGELNHSGIFPSYHYIWFHGFWAWDSWKHAVALAQYDARLAKEQIRAMYAFQEPNGFIPDCVYRDTTIENHNYRNTKPPLSAWAVWKVFEQNADISFLQEMYPKIVLQHHWWYANRDHDQDGICEFGSTDGTLIAAKWESRMDNAVRFDSSKILKNSESAYSLNQESIDLNAYLFAEKKYLAKIAEALGNDKDENTWIHEADKLKPLLQDQFYDSKTGWFYDTSIDGTSFIGPKGCEGWIPLWAELAEEEQAERVKNIMMDTAYFNTVMPFQTLSADHPDFQPAGGYWRGPTWIDQSYFGIHGLHNYGFHQDAYEASKKLIHNAEGLLDKGPTIRENYHPLTGGGFESENFSWSAAHYLLLLLNE